MNRAEYHLSKEQIFGQNIGMMNVPLDFPTRPHNHSFIELVYVVKGTGLHVVDGVEYSVSKGDTCIVDSQVIHNIIPNQGLEVYNCIFEPAFIDKSFSENARLEEILLHPLFGKLFQNEKFNYHFIKGRNNAASSIEAILNKMLIESKRLKFGHLEVLRACLIELLIELLRNSKFLESNGKDAWLDEVLDYIDMNFYKKISVDELASYACLSKVHFSRIFKNYTGVTVTEFIQNKKISKACEMLCYSQKAVTEIMMDVGYHDIKYFYQVFKNITGYSPTQYRKRNIE